MQSLYVNEINFYVMLLYNLLPITNNCMNFNVYLFLVIPYYLYIQELKINEISLLNSHIAISVKDKNKNISSQIKNISKHMTLPITNYMLYLFQDLHKLPHGMHLLQYKDEFEDVCRQYKIPTVHLQSVSNKFSHPIMSFNSDSKELNSFKNIKIDEINLIENLLQHGEKNYSRDKSHIVSKRMNIGFSRPQPNSTNSRYEKNLCLPFFTNKNYMKLNKNLIPQIGNIMEVAQETLDSKYPNAMNDTIRNKLFGKYMSDQFLVKNSRFEFIDILLHSGCVLDKHLDHKNACDNYKYGCSYSFVRTYKNIRYRVNFIMCNRLVCDYFMREYNKK